MQVLKGFLFFCAGALAFGTLLVAWGFSYLHWFPAGLISLAGLSLSWLLFRSARRFARKAELRAQEQFERTFRALAQKNSGTVPLDAMVEASGQTRDEVQKQMRELVGRGVCELSFGDHGEMVFETTPMEESRRELAAFQRVRE